MKKHPILIPTILLALCATGFPAAKESPAPSPTPLVECRVELDRAILPADTPQTAIIKISLDAGVLPQKTERPPVNLCVVIDRSGSMAGSKIENARLAALEALDRLGRDDVFSLVTYDSTVETLIPAAPVANLARAREIIRGITARGNTALFGGVSQGASELRKHMEDGGKAYVHRMIMLSDGLANVGPSSADELGRLGSSLGKEGISVSTIGLGNDYNEDLMTRLSGRSDGNSYFVENSQDLARIFNAELGDVLSVVARKVVVTIVCPEGVRPVRTVGREGVIRGQSVEMRLNHLYGGQERFLLLEVEVPATAANQSRPLARAEVRYLHAITQAEERRSASVEARFSPEEKVVVASANPVVQNAYWLNKGAEAKDESIRLYEAGRRQEAVKLLEFNSQELLRNAAVYDLPELEREARNIASQSERLDRQGLTPGNRKELKTEAFQEGQQQRSKLRYEKY